MKRILFLIIILQTCLGFSSEIEGFYLFEGYKNGDFRDDLVAVLSDGSAWKGHPDDIDILNQWEVGDDVHVEVRISFYWKREHKFRLVNHNKNKSAKVMLINHAEPSLEILFETPSYSTGKEEIPVYAYDENGNEYIKEYIYIDSYYKKTILLSDGTRWELSGIRSRLDDFKVGMKVYLGHNKKSTFIITGEQTKVYWDWIEEILTPTMRR